MRKLGLILVNADGFEPERNFTLRSVQNVQALANSTTRPDPSFAGDFTSNGQNADPPERLGWGNDGAPLRDFALVAIAQHATRTMSRKSGVDFRVPTDEELDAMVAYQLPLGRQQDFDLPLLELKSTQATSARRCIWTRETLPNAATRTATPATSMAAAPPHSRSTPKSGLRVWMAIRMAATLLLRPK